MREKRPWVFGCYIDKKKVRFEAVSDQNCDTLTKLVRKYVAPGSVLVTDEWAGYNRLSETGFVHYKVNHSQNYVDPISKMHKYVIERMWADAKSATMAARGTNHLLQLHLDELSCRKSVRSSPCDVFTAFGGSSQGSACCRIDKMSRGSFF